MKLVKIHVQNKLTPNLLFILVGFAAVALWSTISLTIRLLTTLKHRSGLYFWAMLITSWGIAVRQIGIITINLALECPWVIRRMLVEVGWVSMVSGFSVVLYSRLNIVLPSRNTRRAVLAMILFNGIVWHPTVITLNAGIRYLKNTGKKAHLPSWDRVHDPVENTQIIMFSVQEIVISCFYVRAAYQYLQSGFAKKNKVRGAMFLLLLVQVIIIAADVAIIVIDLAGYTKLKTFIHSFVYTVKVELEFVTLNQLVELSRMGATGCLSFAPAVPDVRAVDKGDEVAKKTLGVVSQQDSAVDLETCASNTSWGAMDFITTPEHMDLR